ncbi:MAG: hypothetical protein INR69_13985 [Mucilaginibacter polytrichastri]|nr:hypothetical protein [Mucilaginibacter polytrichastri]
MGRLRRSCFHLVFFVAILLPPQAVFTQQNQARPDSVVTDFFRRTSGQIASDGGFSVPLKNGGTLWLMGDSHIDDYDPKTNTVPCLFQVRNAGLLQMAGGWDKQTAQTLTGKGPGIKSYIKNRDDDTYFCWPFSGIQTGNTILVYNNSLVKKDDGPFGFAQSGADFWARISYPGMQVQGFLPIADFGGINFGSGFIRVPGDPLIYAYGFRFNPKIMGCEVYIARFAEKKPSEWTFWNGKTWQKDVKKAKIITSQSNVSGTLQVSRIGGQIVILTSEFSMDCDMGKQIFVSSAKKITGPFSEKKSIYSIPDRYKGHSPFFYAANAHPQFINDRNEVLITYAINGYGKCADVCENGRMDPDQYRLKAIRVPLPLLLGR